MLSQIDAIRIFAADFQETKDFYVTCLGFEIGFEGDGVVVFDLPGTKLIVEQIDISEADAAGMVGRFTGISFAVDDIQKAYKELKAKGVSFESKPVKEEWGGAMTHFSDPDNNSFTLIEYPNQD
jgi:catechol 2,3-dioxygenase-like lactoylglutathione lyase family enzyme